jgi:TetR/AcrR family transcriptional regulator
LAPETIPPTDPSPADPSSAASRVAHGSELSAREGDSTRRAILNAAEALFVAHGFAATSTATVARVAGVTKSLIHHHFGSKRELWDAVKLRVMEEYGHQQQQLLDERPPGLPLIEESIRAYFHFLQSHPNVVRFWNWMTIEGDHECPAFSQWVMHQGVDMLRKAQRAGEIRNDVDAEYVLAQVCVLLRGWFIERPILARNVLSESNEAVCDERYLHSITRVFLDGLRLR